MTKWSALENIYLFILIGVLCVCWDSAWPILLIITANRPHKCRQCRDEAEAGRDEAEAAK